MKNSYTHSDEAVKSTALYEADGQRRSALADGSKPVSLTGIELPRPSGPFPFAEDDDYEAIRAAEAGRYPYA